MRHEPLDMDWTGRRTRTKSLKRLEGSMLDEEYARNLSRCFVRADGFILRGFEPIRLLWKADSAKPIVGVGPRTRGTDATAILTTIFFFQMVNVNKAS